MRQRQGRHYRRVKLSQSRVAGRVLLTSYHECNKISKIKVSRTHGMSGGAQNAKTGHAGKTDWNETSRQAKEKMECL